MNNRNDLPTPLEEVAHWFDGAKKKGRGYIATCPVCNSPEHLYINEGEKGIVLIKCQHDHCSFDEIMKAVGHSASDLWQHEDNEPVAVTGSGSVPETKEQKKHKTPIERREHEYQNEAGELVARKTILKYEDGSKNCFWSRWNGSRWIKGLNDMIAPLYNIHEALNHMELPLYVVEGEKDVETMRRLGYIAVSFPNGGGQSTWHEEYAAPFKGRNFVYILTDNDEIGEKYGRYVAIHAVDYAKAVKIISARSISSRVNPKDDITDIAVREGTDNTRMYLETACNAVAPYTKDYMDAIDTAERQDIGLDSFREFIRALNMTIRYNKMTKSTEFENIPAILKGSDDIANAMPVRLTDMYGKYIKRNVGKQTVMDYIFVLADEHSYNPVIDYLSGGDPWDNVDRFPIIYEILGVSDDLEKSLIQKWFIQCVAMAFNDVMRPIQAEGVLILSGEEGIGKSRFFQLMTPHPMWFRSKSNQLRLDNKDNLISVLSGWICELGEIDQTLTAKRSDIKSFITASTDNIRKPYAREETTTARTTSFAGTTNESQFLNETTGFRRWWHVHCNDIDLDRLTKFSGSDELNQFWKQCTSLYKADNTAFRLNKNEQKTLETVNEAVTESMPGEDELRTYLSNSATPEEWKWYSASDLKRTVIGLERYSTQTISKAVAKVFKDNPAYITRIYHGRKLHKLPPNIWEKSK